MRTQVLLHVLSLGLFGSNPEPQARDAVPPYGTLAHVVWRYGVRGRDHPRFEPPPASILGRETRIEALVAAVWTGESLPGYLREYLARQIREETSWALKLVIAVTCASLFLRRGEPKRAARACADASGAYRGFVRLCREEEVSQLPDLLQDYEAWCERTLASFEPPLPAGKDPVQSIVRASQRMRRRRRPTHPDRVMDALDALITAGHARTDADVDWKVIRDVARMLGGRVIFHHAEGRFRRLRPQAEHTLSTWTIHCLVRGTSLRRYRVRPRPEFWQPEQRRPAGVIVFPIGEGVACIGSRERFSRRDAKAVRTVLRFVAERRTSQAGSGQALPGRQVRSKRSLAGEGLIGESRRWRRVLDQVARVASADCSVVLEGETGTGKERLARAIHSASRRSQGPFVAVNCGAIVSDLMAAELFGNIRGAYTGAHRARPGLIRKAHRGTLFLDEVADMPPTMQVALLRVLEERRVVPVGSVRAHDVDVRILCATNRAMRAEVSSGRFREDLYHRLNVVGIRLPPLRERGGDVVLLAEHLLSKIDPPCQLHADSYAVLAQHAWPGNVRELDNVLRAAALLADGPEITPEALRSLLERRERAEPRDSARSWGPRTEALLVALGSRWMSSTDLAGHLDVSPRTVNRDLARLVQRGLVERHGEARARMYRRTSRA